MYILDTTRAEYNREKKHHQGCYFCEAAVIEKQNCTAFNYDLWHVLVNAHPYHNGNVMLVPKSHITTLAELSTEEW